MFHIHEVISLIVLANLAIHDAVFVGGIWTFWGFLFDTHYATHILGSNW